jgi:hypothetical protein
MRTLSAASAPAISRTQTRIAAHTCWASSLVAVRNASTLRWEVKADVGVNWFEEAATPFYPSDAVLQNQLGMQPSSTGQLTTSQFFGQTVVSAALDISARASYQVSPELETGLELGWRSADWFREVICGIYLRNRFNPKPLSVRSRL